ncbi:MAG: NifB/NifX family molybdenum-iron cluster-binding protein [Calditrichia bacterium]
MSERIAITVDESPKGEMQVAEHFGQCLKFMVYDVDDRKRIVRQESYSNPLVGQHGGTCELPFYVKELGVQVIISGGMGRRALNNFNNLNIEVITAPGKKVDDALQGYLNNELSGYQPCEGHRRNCHHDS